MTKTTRRRDNPNFRYLVCLGGGVEGAEIIKRATTKRLIPIIIDEDRYCPARKGIHGQFKHIIRNPYSVRGATWESMFGNSVAGIISCATDTPDVQAAMALRFGLPSVGVKAAHLAKNKIPQYNALRRASIPVPNSSVVDWNTKYDKAFNVLKPGVGRGARGVIRYSTEDEFARAKKIALIESYPMKSLLAQEWIEGIQLSTESVIRNGEIEFTAIAERNYNRLDEFYPYVIEDGSDTPRTMSAQRRYNLDKLILRAATCLGWDNTTVKCDIVFDGYMFYIIEMTCRLSGGFFCTHIIPLAYGVNMADIAIDIATGESYSKIEPVTGRFVCQRFVFPRCEWIGKKVVGLPSPIDSSAEIGLFTVYEKKGDTIKTVTRHSSRLAQCIAVGETPKMAQEICERVVRSAEEQFIVE